jgi:hypothetical protein
VRYDPISQAILSTGLSKSEARDRRINRGTHSPVLYVRLLRELTNTLGLVQNGLVNNRLGNLSSPWHKDHPKLWRLWS